MANAVLNPHSNQVKNGQTGKTVLNGQNRPTVVKGNGIYNPLANQRKVKR